MPARPLVEGGRGTGSWTVQICVRSHVRSQMTVNRCVLGPIVATSSAIQSAAGITARRGAQIGSVRGLRASTFSFERSSPTEFLRRKQLHCSPAYRPRGGEESSSGLVFPKNQKPLALGFRLVWGRTHLRVPCRCCLPRRLGEFTDADLAATTQADWLDISKL